MAVTKSGPVSSSHLAERPVSAPKREAGTPARINSSRPHGNASFISASRGPIREQAIIHRATRESPGAMLYPYRWSSHHIPEIPVRIVLSNIGTFGDINPLIALALELKRRGHVPVLALPNIYRAKIE